MHQKLIKELYPDASSISPMGGGDINAVYQFNNNGQDFVVKVNRSADFPDMFRKEADGLQALSKGMKTPEVIDIHEKNGHQLLVLEHISEGRKDARFWDHFAEQLANVHQITNESFGWHESNYIGSLVQQNIEKHNWADFYMEERLQPMIEMAVNGGDVNYVEAQIINPFYNRLKDIYPEEKPALIHGDLWGGNYIATANGDAVLIDPAVYYGHREMDMAMMQLFGGFDHNVFDTYHENFPLENGWQDRIQYGQLYPLLVHVNLFGRSYWGRVYNILKKFS